MKWKTVLAGTTALVIAGTALAYAKPGDGPGRRADGWRPSAQDMTAFADARIAALKAGLELTPDQQKNWPAVESAMRDLAKQRADRFAARKAARVAQGASTPADPMARLSRRAEAMQDRGAALKKLADAAKPLYDSLNDAQKHRFMVLARLGGFGGGHHGWHREHGRHGMGGWHHHGPRFGGPGMGRGMGPGGPGGPGGPAAQ